MLSTSFPIGVDFVTLFFYNLIRIWRANAFISWCRLKDVVIVPLSMIRSEIVESINHFHALTPIH